jgi:hypothetical protein
MPLVTVFELGYLLWPLAFAAASAAYLVANTSHTSLVISFIVVLACGILVYVLTPRVSSRSFRWYEKHRDLAPAPPRPGCIGGFFLQAGAFLLLAAILFITGRAGSWIVQLGCLIATTLLIGVAAATIGRIAHRKYLHAARQHRSSIR